GGFCKRAHASGRETTPALAGKPAHFPPDSVTKNYWPRTRAVRPIQHIEAVPGGRKVNPLRGDMPRELRVAGCREAQQAGNRSWVILSPVTVSRNENERVLVEPSVNSVRFSIKIKQADEIERILCHKLVRFLMQRAENFIVLRRVPIPGYDISFLITNFHTEQMFKHKLVDFIIEFMEAVDKEISEMKLSLNARARIVAESYLSQSAAFTGRLSLCPRPRLEQEHGNDRAYGRQQLPVGREEFCESSRI
ncbi:MAG: hypothetical protein BJ554DRAFT_5875, partial [Olpidium bornovanus]